MICEGQQIMLQSDTGLVLVGTVLEYDPDDELIVITDTGDEWGFKRSILGDLEDSDGTDWEITTRMPNPEGRYSPTGWRYDGRVDTGDRTGLTIDEAAKIAPKLADEIEEHCATVPGCAPDRIRVRINPEAKKDGVGGLKTKKKRLSVRQLVAKALK